MRLAEANGARGVSSLDFGRHQTDRDLTEDRHACDVVGVSGGWTPVMHLISHKGVKPVWNEPLSAFIVEDTGMEPVSLAGSAAGHFAVDAVVETACPLVLSLNFPPPPHWDEETERPSIETEALREWHLAPRDAAFLAERDPQGCAAALPNAAHSPGLSIWLYRR